MTATPAAGVTQKGGLTEAAGGNYAPQDPSTTYTISVYGRTKGTNWSINPYTADNSEVGRQWGGAKTIPPDGAWHRLS